MKIFGSSAGFQQLSQIGSLAAGSPVYSTDPDVLQALANYIDGWFDVVIGNNSPAIEDMNSLCYLYAYQLAYILQAGIAEWNAGTTYYTGSFVNSGGQLFVSLVDNNLNNAVTDNTKWVSYGVNVSVINPATDSPYTMGVGDNGKTFLVNSANGAMIFNLPTPFLNAVFTFKDAGNDASVNNITINQHASETIDGANSVVINNNYGEVSLVSDGTNWFIINNNLGKDYYAGYMPNGTIWSTTSGSFTDPTLSAGTNALTRRTGNITVTAAVSSLPGITFTPKTASAVYQISAKFLGWNTAGGAVASFKLTDGTQDIAIGEIPSVFENLTLIAPYAPGVSTPVTVKLQLAASTGTTQILTDSSMSPSIEWTIVQIS